MCTVILHELDTYFNKKITLTVKIRQYIIVKSKLGHEPKFVSIVHLFRNIWQNLNPPETPLIPRY